jgi:hypothetical protein
VTRLRPELDFLLEGNSKLNATLSEFVRPIVTRTTLESNGYGEWRGRDSNDDVDCQSADNQSSTCSRCSLPTLTPLAARNIPS